MRRKQRMLMVMMLIVLWLWLSNEQREGIQCSNRRTTIYAHQSPRLLVSSGRFHIVNLLVENNLFVRNWVNCQPKNWFSWMVPVMNFDQLSCKSVILIEFSLVFGKLSYDRKLRAPASRKRQPFFLWTVKANGIEIIRKSWPLLMLMQNVGISCEIINAYTR